MRDTCLLEAMPGASHLSLEPTLFLFSVASFYLLWSKLLLLMDLILVPFFSPFLTSLLLLFLFVFFWVFLFCNECWLPAVVTSERSEEHAATSVQPFSHFFSIGIG